MNFKPSFLKSTGSTVARVTFEVFLALALFVLPASVHAFEPVKVFTVVLLQEEAVVKERMPDTVALNKYIQKLESSLNKVAWKIPQHARSSGFVVVALKPGGKSKFWLDLRPALDNQTASNLLAAAKSPKPVAVRKGVVVFAFKVGLWGGAEPVATNPSPAEWKKEGLRVGHPMDIGELVERIWKD